jgi:hypothetical protein
MDTTKSDFVNTGFFEYVQNLSPEAMGKWGKMNAQQMVEHVTSFFKLSSAKIILPIVSPDEQLPKLKAFLLSDKEFRENTKAPQEVLGDEPLPLRNETMEAALAKLKHSIEEFFQFFAADAGNTSSHPVFGVLNFNEWILLHYKHVLHHAKQFGYTKEG